MGVIQHHLVAIATSRSDGEPEKAFEQVRQFALALNQEDDAHVLGEHYDRLLVRVQGLVNGEVTYLVAPDGSKEGWATSDRGDRLRAEFVRVMGPFGYYGAAEMSWGESGSSVDNQVRAGG